MNRPYFQSQRRKTQHSSMFYCIQQSAISPTEKRNLGDLDKIFSSPNGFWTCFDTFPRSAIWDCNEYDTYAIAF